MTSARDNETHPHTHLIPHHQRIISSKQWIIEKNNKEPVVKPSSSNTAETMTTTTSTTKTKSKTKTKMTASTSVKNHINIKPKAASPSTTSPDKESKRKVKEMENTKLQLEYSTVKQENDKLKNVINKLKQEIDIYTNLLNDTNRKDHTNKYENHPLMKSLLINTSKRRKLKSDLTTSTSSKKERKEGNEEVAQIVHQISASDVNPGAEKAHQEEMVSPDDIMLMNTLTDVLAHME